MEKESMGINYADLFDPSWAEYECHLLDYRKLSGSVEMGGWLAGGFKTLAGKNLRFRKDWRLPYHEGFDMTDQVEEAKKAVRESVIQFIKDAVDEKLAKLNERSPVESV